MSRFGFGSRPCPSELNLRLILTKPTGFTQEGASPQPRAFRAHAQWATSLVVRLQGAQARPCAKLRKVGGDLFHHMQKGKHSAQAKLGGRHWLLLLQKETIARIRSIRPRGA